MSETFFDNCCLKILYVDRFHGEIYPGNNLPGDISLDGIYQSGISSQYNICIGKLVQKKAVLIKLVLMSTFMERFIHVATVSLSFVLVTTVMETSVHVHLTLVVWRFVIMTSVLVYFVKVTNSLMLQYLCFLVNMVYKIPTQQQQEHPLTAHRL